MGLFFWVGLRVWDAAGIEQGRTAEDRCLGRVVRRRPWEPTQTRCPSHREPADYLRKPVAAQKKSPSTKGHLMIIGRRLLRLNAIVGFINVFNLKIHSCISVCGTKFNRIRTGMCFSDWKTMDADFFFAAAECNHQNAESKKVFKLFHTWYLMLKIRNPSDYEFFFLRILALVILISSPSNWTVMVSPSEIRPLMISSANESSMNFWMARFKGLAP